MVCARRGGGRGKCACLLTPPSPPPAPAPRARPAGALLTPLLDNAGKDVSHWFKKDRNGNVVVKTRIDPRTSLEMAYTPCGRFVHVPPEDPLSTWRTDFGVPWWQDDVKYVIGRLSERTRKLRVVNTLAKTEHVLEAGAEETLGEIQDRYLDANSHASSYTWKALGDAGFRPLDMALTLAENGVGDDGAAFERLGIDEDDFIPVVHLYFNDDLTVA